MRATCNPAPSSYHWTGIRRAVSTRPGVVESVVIADETQTMYDLDVETVDTFAVGDGAWVVHNAHCAWTPNRPPAGGEGIYRFDDLTHLDSSGNPLPYVGSDNLRDWQEIHLASSTGCSNYVTRSQNLK